MCIFFNSLIAQNPTAVALYAFEFSTRKKTYVIQLSIKKNRVVLHFISSLISIAYKKKIPVNIGPNMYKYCLIYYYTFLTNGNSGSHVCSLLEPNTEIAIG